MSKPKKQCSERCVEIRFHAFDYNVRVIFSTDVVRSRIARDKILGKYDGVRCSAMHCWNPSQAISYLFLPHKVPPATVAHEAWHAVRRMLRFCGAELDNEVVAYHLGYLVGEIHRKRNGGRE